MKHRFFILLSILILAGLACSTSALQTTGDMPAVIVVPTSVSETSFAIANVATAIPTAVPLKVPSVPKFVQVAGLNTWVADTVLLKILEMGHYYKIDVAGGTPNYFLTIRRDKDSVTARSSDYWVIETGVAPAIVQYLAYPGAIIDVWAGEVYAGCLMLTNGDPILVSSEQQVLPNFSAVFDQSHNVALQFFDRTNQIIEVILIGSTAPVIFEASASAYTFDP